VIRKNIFSWEFVLSVWRKKNSMKSFANWLEGIFLKNLYKELEWEKKWKVLSSYRGSETIFSKMC
jgi:hypothetical protein